jgi:hypothetical protein
MAMSIAESDRYWRDRLNQRMVLELRSSGFLHQLQCAHLSGLLTELLEDAGVPLEKLQSEIGCTLSGRLSPNTAG